MKRLPYYCLVIQLGNGLCSVKKNLDLLKYKLLFLLLEHMVFMGTTKYPDENAFDVFNRKHGGHDNAHTDCETTTFYFETPRRHFAEGLERFSQFFIAPLMKLGSMQREREAVHSEFEMALPSHYDRVQQVRSLLCNLALEQKDGKWMPDKKHHFNAHFEHDKFKDCLKNYFNYLSSMRIRPLLTGTLPYHR